MSEMVDVSVGSEWEPRPVAFGVRGQRPSKRRVVALGRNPDTVITVVVRHGVAGSNPTIIHRNYLLSKYQRAALNETADA